MSSERRHFIIPFSRTASSFFAQFAQKRQTDGEQRAHLIPKGIGMFVVPAVLNWVTGTFSRLLSRPPSCALLIPTWKKILQTDRHHNQMKYADFRPTTCTGLVLTSGFVLIKSAQHFGIFKRLKSCRWRTRVESDHRKLAFPVLGRIFDVFLHHSSWHSSSARLVYDLSCLIKLSECQCNLVEVFFVQRLHAGSYDKLQIMKKEL